MQPMCEGSMSELNNILFGFCRLKKFCVARASEEEVDISVKSQIYEKMKNNLKNLNLDAELTALEYVSYEKGETIEKSRSNLRSIVDKTDKLDECKSEHYCILGTEVANFKYLHIIKM